MKDYLKWLIDNQGKYEIRPDNSVWTDLDGKSTVNKISMSYKGTMMSFTGESGLIGAINFFMGEDGL